MQTKEMRLMGAAEIAARLGVGRQRGAQIRQDEHFPAPVATLTMGAIYAADDVEAWIAAYREPTRCPKCGSRFNGGRSHSSGHLPD